MSDDTLDGFAFGQHFVCDCCNAKMTTVHKGLRQGTFFILPLCSDPDLWHEKVATLLENGWTSADLCGKCHL